MEQTSGLGLERRGDGNYYKVILHFGSTLIPISDDIIEELQANATMSPNQYFSFFLEKVGYSSYLREQIQQVVEQAGDVNTQMANIQQFLRQGES